MSRAPRTAMAAVLRILSTPFLLALAGTLAGPSQAAPSPPEPQRQTLRAFFDELGRDRLLRTRFAESPKGVLAEHGLELPSFALPDRLTEFEIERLLTRWPAIAEATAPHARERVDQEEIIAMQVSPAPPTPVYGPPGGFRQPPRAPNSLKKDGAAPPRPGNGAPDDKPPSGIY